MATVVVVAPHPDDETLGCGGTLLRHKRNGDDVHWLIVTHVSEASGYSLERVQTRNQEIERVAARYAFDSTTNLQFAPASLDRIPMGELVNRISFVFRELHPEIVYLPYAGDAHTDHSFVSDAVLACTKWFRYPEVRRVLAYETLSETDFGIRPDRNGFRPNVFVDISEFLDDKIEVMKIYQSELGSFPFPRSEEAIFSLAKVRGAASGFKAAEAFMLLRESV